MNIPGTPGNDNLFGTNDDDLILGFDGNDTLRGRRGNDELDGGDGNDKLRGQKGDDELDGGDGNDRLFGNGGDDTLVGSAGNDKLNGGGGFDTVDYSQLGQQVTLQALGVVDKGALGKDQLIGFGPGGLNATIEVIIGALGQNNTIDGTLPAGATGFFDIDLAANSFQIGGLGAALEFEVINFVDVIGTRNDDVISGDSGDNTIFGSAGDDDLSGGNGGFDTVDYSDLGQKVTLKALGTIDKGSLGEDIIVGLGPDELIPSIDKIIGAEGKNNKIDGSPVGGFANAASFDIDLAEDNLTINGLGASLEFEVVEFVDVTGTLNDDNIEGNSDDNSIFAGGGEDRIVGVDDLSPTPGRGEIDVLSGGTDGDTFILGDDSTSYYLGDGSTPFGLKDYAFVADFQFGVDNFVVSNTIDYVLNFAPGEVIEIFADINDNKLLDQSDDLVAKLSLGKPINPLVNKGIGNRINNSLDEINIRNFNQLINSKDFVPIVGIDGLEELL